MGPDARREYTSPSGAEIFHMSGFAGRSWLRVGTCLIVVSISVVYALVAGTPFAWDAAYICLLVTVYVMAVWFISGKMVYVSRPKLNVVLEAGDKVEFPILISYPKWLPLRLESLTTILPDALRFRVEGPVVVDGTRRARTLQTWMYHLPNLPRGKFYIGETYVVTRDMLGLLYRNHGVSADEFITVRPRTVPVFKHDVEERGMLGGHDAPSLYRYPNGTHLAGVRPFTPGDRLTQIHWPATARTQTVQSKAMEIGIEQYPHLVMDLTAPQNLVLFELGVSVIASFAKHFALKGIAFRLTMAGESVETFRFGPDRTGWAQCAEFLSLVKPAVASNIPSVLESVLVGMRDTKSIIFVSPFCSDDVVQQVRKASAHGTVDWFVPGGLEFPALSSRRLRFHSIYALDELSRLGQGDGRHG